MTQGLLLKNTDVLTDQQPGRQHEDTEELLVFSMETTSASSSTNFSQSSQVWFQSMSSTTQQASPADAALPVACPSKAETAGVLNIRHLNSILDHPYGSRRAALDAYLDLQAIRTDSGQSFESPQAKIDEESSTDGHLHDAFNSDGSTSSTYHDCHQEDIYNSLATIGKVVSPPQSPQRVATRAESCEVNSANSRQAYSNAAALQALTRKYKILREARENASQRQSERGSSQIRGDQKGSVHHTAPRPHDSAESQKEDKKDNTKFPISYAILESSRESLSHVDGPSNRLLDSARRIDRSKIMTTGRSHGANSSYSSSRDQCSAAIPETKPHNLVTMANPYPHAPIEYQVIRFEKIDKPKEAKKAKGKPARILSFLRKRLFLQLVCKPRDIDLDQLVLGSGLMGVMELEATDHLSC